MWVRGPDGSHEHLWLRQLVTPRGRQRMAHAIGTSYKHKWLHQLNTLRGLPEDGPRHKEHVVFKKV